VTALDAAGNPVQGASVVLGVTGSGTTLTQPAAVTDVNGERSDDGLDLLDARR
jgi:hypothetical protein